MNELREEGEVILCGDFNSRIGQKTGMIRDLSTDFVPLPDDYEPDSFLPRNSLDSITNTSGTHFLNLVKHNQLTILNGRTLGDLVGNFMTSIQKNGCSVIDYIAVTNSINSLNIELLQKFKYKIKVEFVCRCSLKRSKITKLTYYTCN